MKVECDICLVLPICISKIKVKNIGGFSYGCSIDWKDLDMKCEYFMDACSNVRSQEFQDLKYFLLKTKGYFNDRTI